MAYGKFAETYSRHCVFIGSTNDSTFLRDNTSMVERRFWVIKCNKKKRDGSIFNILTNDYIEQLWSESVYYYKENPNQYLDIPKELIDDFGNEMKQFKTFTDDVVIDYVNSILNRSYYLNEKGEFDSETDMLNQYTKDDIYTNKTKTNISRIPFSYLRYILKNVYHEERTGTYIGNGISNDWEYKSIRYKNITCKGFERKRIIDIN